MIQIFKKKIFTKALALWVIFCLVFNPLFPAVALADEVVPPESQTPAVSDSSPASSPESSPTPEPTSSITTGDAESGSEASTVANSNTDNIPGTVTDGGSCSPPDVTPECPVSNNNFADTSGTNTSTAQTGQNSSSDSEGDVSIQTGEATSSAETTNQINTNIVALTGDSDTTPEATESAVAENNDPDPLSITNQNEALVQNEAASSAGTGENTASDNQGDVVVDTGDATAVGNMLNLVNLNVVGSDFEILVLNLTDQQGDINLFNIWKELSMSAPDGLFIAGNATANSLGVLVQNQNQASLQNSLQVVAVSGQNTAEDNGGAAAVQTGDAKAVANLANVVNTNIVGSKLLFVIINVLGSYNGNLVLPKREDFESAPAEALSNGGSVSNENTATLTGGVAATADSGGNELSGNSNGSVLQTGEAEAISHNISLINFNILGYNWFNFLVNHLGSQSGQVWGWSDPEAKEEPAGSFSAQSLQASGGTLQNGGTDITNSNSADIASSVSALAVSGQNQANGNDSATVVTGKSKALANLFNLVNFNIIGGNFFLGAINILGDWQGNTVFAYPDVTASLSGPSGDVRPGEEIDYTVSFKNQGYDDAHGLGLSFELPKGTEFVSETSGLAHELSGKMLSWLIGDLPAGASGSFSVKVKVKDNLVPADLLSWWDKLIPVAYAAEEDIREDIVARVALSTIDSQLNSKNDSAETSTTVLFPADGGGSGEAAMTTIDIKAKNNVNGFVYQGDVITFELEVKNTGGETAKSVTVSQDIYDGQPESTGSVDFPLGDMAPGKVVTINFGIQVTDLPPDDYHSVARAFGDNISSNEARTDFEIRSKSLSFIPEVLAQEESGEEAADVLAVETSCPAPVKARKEWWPYVLAGLFGTLWFLELTRRKQWDTALVDKIKSLKRSLKK